MHRPFSPATSNDYVLRAEIELDNSLLHIEGEVLEHFRSDSLGSQGRFLLRGATAAVEGSELRIYDRAGAALILLPVPPERVGEAERFAASVRYAASGTAALEDAVA